MGIWDSGIQKKNETVRMKIHHAQDVARILISREKLPDPFLQSWLHLLFDICPWAENMQNMFTFVLVFPLRANRQHCSSAASVEL